MSVIRTNLDGLADLCDSGTFNVEFLTPTLNTRDFNPNSGPYNNLISPTVTVTDVTLNYERVCGTSGDCDFEAGFSVGSVCQGEPATFTDASLGADPETVTWTWFLDDDDTPDATGPGPIEYTYDSPGTYTARLVLSDGSCSDTAAFTLEVRPQPNAPPHPRLTLYGPGGGLHELRFDRGLLVGDELRIYEDDAGANLIESATVDDVPFDFEFTKFVNTVDCYFLTTYYLQLERNGCTSPLTPVEAEYINEDSCNLQALIEARSACVGDTVRILNNSTVNDPDSTVYRWDFDGDDVVDFTGPGPIERVYDQPGTYTVSLFVEDVGNLRDTARVTFDVLPRPARITHPPVRVCNGLRTIIPQGTKRPGETLSLYADPQGQHLLSSTDADPWQLAVVPDIGTVTEYYATTYYLQNSNGLCSSELTPVPVEFFPPVEVEVISDFCAVPTTRLNLQATAVPEASYAWSGPNGWQASTRNAAVDPADPRFNGVYSLTVSIPGCPDQTLTTDSVVIEQPVAAFQVQASCVNDLSVMTVTTPQDPDLRYFWDVDGDQQTDYAGYGPISHSYTTPGRFAVNLTVETPRGCRRTFREEALIRPVPTAVRLPQQTVCAPGPYTLALNEALLPDERYELLTADTLGAPVVAFDQTAPYRLTTPVIDRDTTFFIRRFNGACAGPLTPVRFRVLPQLTATARGNFCTDWITDIRLEATSLPNATYAWTGPAGFRSIERSPLLPQVGTEFSGNYIVRATVPGCPQLRDTVSVSIGNPPRLAKVSANSPLCVGETLRLGVGVAPATATVNWFGPNGFTSNMAAPEIPNATPALNGRYFVSATLGGCTSDTLSVEVEVRDDLLPLRTVANNTVCVGNALRLSAETEPGANVTWISPQGDPYNLATLVFNAATQNEAGFWRVEAVNANGCRGVDTVEIVVSDVPGPFLSGGVLTGCPGDNLQLTARFEPNAQYLWTGPNGFTSTRREPQLANLTPQDAGIYELRVVVGSCTSNVEQYRVEVGPIEPPVVAQTEYTRCGPGPVVIEAQVDQPDRFVLLLDENDQLAGFSSQAPHRFTIEASARQSVYRLVAQNRSRCQSAPTPVVVNVLPPPAPASAPTVSRCSYGSVTFTGQMGQPEGRSLRLFTAPTGGNPVAENNLPPYTLTTPALTTTTTFYIESYTSDLCVSQARVPVVARLDLLPAPTIPPVTHCGTQDIRFRVQPAGPVAGVRLYTQAEPSVMPIAATSLAPYELTAPAQPESATYFLSTYDARGCESARVPATVNRVELLPPRATSLNRCGPGNFVFTVNNVSDGEIRLYGQASGGVPIDLRSQPPYWLGTPNVSRTTTFFLSRRVDQCETPRIQVVGTVLPGVQFQVATNPPSNTQQNNGLIAVTQLSGTDPYTFTLNDTLTQNTPTFANLPAGTYRIRVTDAQGCTAEQEVVLGERPLSCGAPTDLRVLTDGPIQAVWSAIPGAMAYELEYRQVGVSSWSAPIRLTDTSFTFRNLNSEAQYEVRVRTICEFQTSNFVTAPFETRICNAVNFIFTQDVTHTSARAIWLPMLGASGYDFRWKETFQPQWRPTETYPATVTERLFNGLRSGTSYDVGVRTLCQGNSVRSAEVYGNFTTQSCRPAPGGLRITRVTATTAELTWFHSPYANAYEIGWSADGGNTWQDSTTSQTQLTLTNLQPGTMYRVRMRAICSGGPSYFLFNSFMTPTQMRTGTEESVSATSDFRFEVMPNPSRGVFQVQAVGSLPGQTQCRVLNLTGQTILQGEFHFENGQAAQLLDLTDFPAGVYTLVIQPQNGVPASLRLIKR